MELPQLSVDAYIALVLVIATPWLYRTFSPFSNQKPSRSTKDQLLSSLLLLHTLYVLYDIFVSPPQSIFKVLGFPVNIPPDYLRSKLVETLGGEANVPPYLDALLKRLGLMELRSLYILFGHDALTTCTYCQSYNDFALYSLSSPLLEYIREIAFVGILTLPNSSTSYLRPLGLGALLASLMTEAYWTLTVQVVIPPFGNNAPTTMWHNIFVQLRHTLFLLLPLLISILPSLGLHRIPIIGVFIPRPAQSTLPPSQFQLPGQQSAIPPAATLNDVTSMTLNALGHLVPTLHLLKYTHAAVMRSQSDDEQDGPSFYARASKWWAEEASEGAAVRSDGGVRKILKSTGLGIEEAIKDGETVVQPEGQLLQNARAAVSLLKEHGVKPSEHWVYA